MTRLRSTSCSERRAPWNTAARWYLLTRRHSQRMQPENSIARYPAGERERPSEHRVDRTVQGFFASAASRGLARNLHIGVEVDRGAHASPQPELLLIRSREPDNFSTFVSSPLYGTCALDGFVESAIISRLRPGLSLSGRRTIRADRGE